MDLAGSCNNLVFVYSLASSSDTFADETAELQETIRASARQERILRPSTDVEIYNIVKQRLFHRVDEKAAKKATQEYLNAYRSSRLTLPDGCQDATYSQTIESSYPIHPELFNLLTKKIASIPNFNRTRGALRLFAIATRHLWRGCLYVGGELKYSSGEPGESAGCRDVDSLVRRLDPWFSRRKFA